MTLFTVTITGVVNPIEIYGGVLAAIDYLGSSSTDGAVAWTALAADPRARALVDATRFVDALAWQGAADAQGGTTLQWPRSGVLNADGTTLDSTTVPAVLVKAVFELAGMVAVDPGVLSAVDSGSNVAEAAAGTARVRFFRSTSAIDGTATVLPIVINRLIGQWLASAQSPPALSQSTGTECESQFEHRRDRREWPF